MGNDEKTPVETPIPLKIRRLEERIHSKESSDMEKHPQVGRCPEHSGLVIEINNLKEDLVEERKARKEDVAKLEVAQKEINKEVVKVRMNIQKIMTAGFIFIGIIQLAIKFIPFGGH